MGRLSQTSTGVPTGTYARAPYVLDDGSYELLGTARTFVGGTDPTTLGFTPAKGDQWIGGTGHPTAATIVDSRVSTAFPASNAISVAKPTCAVGDWLYVGTFTENGSPTITGYTLVDSMTLGGIDVHVLRRKVDGTEGANISVALGVGTQQVTIACSVRGAADTAPSTGKAQGSTATVTPPMGDSLLLGFEGSTGIQTRTATPPNGWVEVRDANADYDFRQGSLAQYVAANNSPLTYTWGLAPAGGEGAVVMVAIPPASPPPSATPARYWNGTRWI